MIEKEYALIVAGGRGKRFGSALPKQFLELNGKPVLLHTVEAFYRYSPDITVVLVLSEEDQPTWLELAQKFHFQKPVILQPGGTTRFQSVRNGLKIVRDGFVAIHDGVRPLVSVEIIAESFRMTRIHRCAVAAVPVKDSIRMVDSATPDAAGELSTRAVDRSRFMLMQTPQTFDSALIKKAYDLPEDPRLTDDASVAERAGAPIHLIQGSYENIKITTSEDLAIAAALVAHRGGDNAHIH